MNREELIAEVAATIAVAELLSTRRTWGDLLEPQKDEYRRVASAVLAVFEKAKCKRCGQLAEGYAFIGDDQYCHPDGGVDCYTLASHDLTSLANQAFIEKAQAPTDDEREALSNFLFSVYEHGSQPNALREADAILSFLASRRPAQGEPTGDVRQTCAWCPGDARGSAWWNDGRLHPSCGQIGHGEGWVPDERAVRPARGDYFEGFEEGVTVGRGTPAQTEPIDPAELPLDDSEQCPKCGHYACDCYAAPDKPTDDRGEAEAMYPLDGGDPSIIIALRSAYRAGVAREGRAALTAGQVQREALAEAWDEGYIQRMYDYPADEDERINPYRIVTAGQEEQS